MLIIHTPEIFYEYSWDQYLPKYPAIYHVVLEKNDRQPGDHFLSPAKLAVQFYKYL